MYCPACGTKNKEAAKFCENCGQKIYSPKATKPKKGIKVGFLIALIVALGLFGFLLYPRIKNMKQSSSNQVEVTKTLDLSTSTQLPVTKTVSFTSTSVFLSPTPTYTPKPTANPTSSLTPSPKIGIGSKKISPVDGMVMIYIPAGEFEMGSIISEYDEEDERPVHSVYLNAYWVDKYEVTTTQFAKFLNENNLGYAWEYADKPLALIGKINGEWVPRLGYEDHPATYVDWNGAKTYCEWAGRRLPTEAEWEKAAGGGSSNQRWPWGNEWDCNKTNAMTECDDFDRTSPVGSFPHGASPYGALDMAGNVWEWVDDWYDARAYEYPGSPKNGLEKVLRGGSYLDDRSGVRTTDRDDLGPTYATGQAGFRCVKSIEDK